MKRLTGVSRPGSPITTRRQRQRGRPDVVRVTLGDEQANVLPGPLDGMVGTDAVAPAMGKEAVAEVIRRTTTTDRDLLIDLGTAGKTGGQRLIDGPATQPAHIVGGTHASHHLVPAPTVGATVVLSQSTHSLMHDALC